MTDIKNGIESRERELRAELEQWKQDSSKPEILMSNDEGDKEQYEAHREIFNRRFQKFPIAILLCETEEHIVAVTELANKYEWPLKVRSGGHDHEGFCTGDNALAIDLRRMHAVEQDEQDPLTLRVQPGIRFKDLVLILNRLQVCIPHGTCGTVNVAGFTMGGGWGPWTRIQGMCTEHLVGARLVLKTGEVIEVSNQDTDQRSKDILWALRGGGGVSCGIVTRFIYKAFEMPPNTIKFNLVWQGKPALKVLELWENIVSPGINANLIGTNLMIAAVNPDDVSADIAEAAHDCTFFGYYAGTYDELKQSLDEWFSALPPTQVNIPIAPVAGAMRRPGLRRNADNTGTEIGNGVSDELFDESLLEAIETHNNTRGRLLRSGPGTMRHNIQIADDDFSIFRTWDMPVKESQITTAKGRTLGYIPPDSDDPSPHKITSKVMKWLGEGTESAARQEARIRVIKSLQSPLVPRKDQQPGSHGYNACNVKCYATLGAITGPYYTQHTDYPDAIGCAMPYRHDFYTVQYQAWWDNYCVPEGDWPLAWIAGCRDFSFPETEGSFISFRDKEVPYSTYFLQNYDRLKAIMDEYAI